MTNQMNKILSVLTSALNIHLNIGQDLVLNTPNVFTSLETLSPETLSNRKIQQVGTAQVSLPAKFNLTTNSNSTLSLRVR